MTELNEIPCYILQLMMAKVDQFLNDLVYYDKENIHPDIVKVCLFVF